MDLQSSTYVDDAQEGDGGDAAAGGWWIAAHAGIQEKAEKDAAKRAIASARRDARMRQRALRSSLSRPAGAGAFTSETFVSDGRRGGMPRVAVQLRRAWRPGAGVEPGNCGGETTTGDPSGPSLAATAARIWE